MLTPVNYDCCYVVAHGRGEQKTKKCVFPSGDLERVMIEAGHVGRLFIGLYELE